MLPFVSNALSKSEKKFRSTLSYCFFSYTLSVWDLNEYHLNIIWGFSFSAASLVHTLCSLPCDMLNLGKCSSYSVMTVDSRKWHLLPSWSLKISVPFAPDYVTGNLRGGAALCDNLYLMCTLLLGCPSGCKESVAHWGLTWAGRNKTPPDDMFNF